jgi:hypothetical protein
MQTGAATQHHDVSVPLFLSTAVIGRATNAVKNGGRCSAAHDPVADIRSIDQHAWMKTWAPLPFAFALSAGAIAGWIGRGVVEGAECAYMAKGYERLTGNLRQYAKYPSQDVSDKVLAGIQRCWAAQPYVGPRHSIEFVEARVVPDGGYYVIFEPIGVTDVQLAFRVDRSGSAVQAFQYSTL